MNTLGSGRDGDIDVSWLRITDGEAQVWVDELVGELERREGLQDGAIDHRPWVGRALEEALDARVCTQEEIGQLFEEILRRAQAAARRRSKPCQRLEYDALEHVLDGALAQAEQEDAEIERIIANLLSPRRRVSSTGVLAARSIRRSHGGGAHTSWSG